MISAAVIIFVVLCIMHSASQCPLHSLPMHSVRMATNENIIRGKRLERARVEAGFDTASEAARALELSEPTYMAHENGSRGFKGSAERYSAFFKVSLEWLWSGKGQMKRRGGRSAPAVGYIGAGSEVVPFDDHAPGAGLEDVEIPPGVPEDSVVVIVRGDSMYPRYKDGERLFYIKTERNPADLIGQECVVKLEDGRMYVKDLEKGSGGGFDLISHNAPPLRNQAVEWAAPVLARVNKGVGR